MQKLVFCYQDRLLQLDNGIRSRLVFVIRYDVNILDLLKSVCIHRMQSMRTSYSLIGK